MVIYYCQLVGNTINKIEPFINKNNTYIAYKAKKIRHTRKELRKMSFVPQSVLLGEDELISNEELMALWNELNDVMQGNVGQNDYNVFSPEHNNIITNLFVNEFQNMDIENNDDNIIENYIENGNDHHNINVVTDDEGDEEEEPVIVLNNNTFAVVTDDEEEEDDSDYETEESDEEESDEEESDEEESDGGSDFSDEDEYTESEEEDDEQDNWIIQPIYMYGAE